MREKYKLLLTHELGKSSVFVAYYIDQTASTRFEALPGNIPVCRRLLLVTAALARTVLQRLGFEPMDVVGTDMSPSPMLQYLDLRNKSNWLGEHREE